MVVGTKWGKELNLGSRQTNLTEGTSQNNKEQEEEKRGGGKEKYQH